VENSLLRMRQAYVRLEPPGQDTWNPLHDEVELWHRARLLLEACRQLRRLPQPLQDLRVLDVGCGVGRSTRLLVDLGVAPERLVATDLRPDALATARASNPAVDWRQLGDLDDWPAETFDLVVQCTVFSSIPGDEARRATAALMSRSAGACGHVLWWDSRVANDFAGGDSLDPRQFFPDRELVEFKTVPMLPTMAESLRPLRGLRPLAGALLQPLSHSHTHCIALFGPKRRAPVMVPAGRMPAAPAPATAEAHGKDLLRALPLQSATQAGLTLGAWEVFQHRPLLDVYARHYGQRVVDADGVLVVVKDLPLLGAMRAQVYSPEAGAGMDWPHRLERLPVGAMVVMSPQPADASWLPNGTEDLVSMVIDLRGDEQAMWARFEQRARTAARKAERAGVEIVPTVQPSDVIDFYNVVHRLSDAGRRFPLAPLALVQALIEAGHGTLYLARLGAQVLGGCVVLRHRYAHALLSGFDAQACGGLPSTHLYVQIMLHEQALGIPYLDFGPHSVRLHAQLVLAKRAFKPLIVPAYRYERPGAGWRPKALALAFAVRGQRGG
jgi:SAM-dependent methyltransferase